MPITTNKEVQAAKKKKNSNNIVVGDYEGNPKVVGTSEGGFNPNTRTVIGPGADPNKHADLPGARNKKVDRDYQMSLKMADDPEPETELSTTFGDVTNETSTSTSKKKPGGTVSYKDAYTAAGGADKLGDYAKWEKKAKDWNTKKYGTTEPTAKAAKFTGGSKTKLASEHTASQTKMERREAVPIETSTSSTSSNNRMQQAIASANAPASLMSGTKTRRETRQANREQRQGDRQTNRDNKEANRIRHAGQKATTQRANKERRQDSRQDRGDKRFERKTGINMSGSSTAGVDWKSSLNNKQILGSERNKGTYRNPGK